MLLEPRTGLFPQEGEIEYRCDCPDWAEMCKHVAAVMYGIGHRLDTRPELLFLLRGVDAGELIAADVTLPASGEAASGDLIADDQLGAVFGIDLDAGVDGATEADAGADRVVEVKPRKPRRGGRKKKKAARRPARIAKKKTARRPARTAKKATAKKVTAKPRIRPTGKSVARLRKRLGLSVSAFAERLDVSPATVYRWQATDGRLKLRPDALLALDRLHRSRARSA